MKVDDLPAISEGFTLDMIRERINNLNKVRNSYDS